MTDKTSSGKVLVWLVGGPGSPGSRMAAEIAAQFAPRVLAEYQLVLISGRGTGATALRCPRLQEAMGRSDLVVPPQAAITECAQTIGDTRRFYATPDTVADLDLLRRALGVSKLTLAGASYGTYVAAHYAIRYPQHVDRLVLDSAMPHDSFDVLGVSTFNRAATVLRTVCAQMRCGTDPAADLATVVRTRGGGTRLLPLLVERTHGAPRLSDLPEALHQAAWGNGASLDALIAQSHSDRAATYEQLSQGLHAATLCQDMRGPWGDAATPLAGRAAAVSAAVASLDSRLLWPFDAATAGGNGQVVTCAMWPATPVVPAPVHALLPSVPVLLLAGDMDLDTPLDWTQHEASLAPHGRLVVVTGAGHITQDLTNPPAGREAVTEFLTSGP